ncbi:lytic polysaccharide monooxygenase auxiliary activity family 9 protein [Serratia entomophila]|uniref:lytic polysaccharide monooxygenase auxiliary activity family 9 protein n=1 Tax=Serratia entomophila TaxID=42906 RepID=UPI0021BA5863|nr:lytic polysaccharide monooxygenase auxiliary activity family 9 protein [Serratia entomophila]
MRKTCKATQHPSDKVPDGQLCSAGITKFEGIDQPHADWQVSSVAVKDGQATLYFDATQVHEPSKWTVSLARPSFNAATDKLKWSELTPLEVTKVIVPPPAKGNHVKYAGVYQLEVKIPADRADGKQTLLYVQWEREDPARETFFSCSDVKFNGLSAAK